MATSSFFPGATQPIVNGGTLQAANELFIYNDHRSAVQAASDALTSARRQYDLVKGNKRQCNVLIYRCQNLVEAASNQIQREGLSNSMRDNIHVLTNTCIAIKDIITNLASQPFAWRLLNQDKTDRDLKAAESKLLDAISIFNISAQVHTARLQREIANSMAEAAKIDHADLVTHLNGLSENDHKILHALQENHERTEELLVALTKHVQNIHVSVAASATPSERFMQNAVWALQRLSKAPITPISAWQLTSLEVTFSRDDRDSQIGQGSFGTVFKGLWQGEIVAVKEMYIEDARSIKRSLLKAVHNEIAIWSRLSNPRIVQFYGACLEATRPFLVSRFCQNGNILDYLKKSPSKNRLKLMHEVSVGMVYLHNQSIIHADLKGANILIDHDGMALISDFGISQLKDQAGTTSTNHTGKEKTKGTLRWMAPELIEGEKLDFPVDVYSFGITVWEVYTLEVPFSNLPERAFYRHVIDKQERPKCPPSMDDGLIDLVSRCWAHKATERPTFNSTSSTISTLLSGKDLQGENLRNPQITSMVSSQGENQTEEEYIVKAQARMETYDKMETDELKRSNQLLWQDAMAARERHHKQQDTINRIVKFLAGVFGSHSTQESDTVESPSTNAVIPRKAQLLIEDVKRDAAGEGNRKEHGTRALPTSSPTPFPSQNPANVHITEHSVTSSGSSSVIEYEPLVQDLLNKLSPNQIRQLAASISTQNHTTADDDPPSSSTYMTTSQPLQFDSSSHPPPSASYVPFPPTSPDFSTVLPDEEINSSQYNPQTVWQQQHHVDQRLHPTSDVNALNSSIKSLIQNFGLDPSVLNTHLENDIYDSVDEPNALEPGALEDDFDSSFNLSQENGNVSFKNMTSAALNEIPSLDIQSSVTGIRYVFPEVDSQTRKRKSDVVNLPNTTMAPTDTVQKAKRRKDE